MKQMVGQLSAEKTIFQLQKAGTTDRNHACILFVTLFAPFPVASICHLVFLVAKEVVY